MYWKQKAHGKKEHNYKRAKFVMKFNTSVNIFDDDTSEGSADGYKDV